VIPGLLQLLVFQGLGELLARFVVPAVPGPVLGLLALLGWLRLRRRVAPGLATVSDAFSANLGLLFVPAAVGVVMFLPQLAEHWIALGAALLVSVVATLAVSAGLLRLLSGEPGPPGPPTGAATPDAPAPGAAGRPPG
jgi:holin-like protein